MADKQGWLSKMAQMLKQYGQDAMPGGALNPEQQPIADRAKYMAGALDPSSQISQDLQGWHKRTQAGLTDQLAGRETPAAEYAYQQMMNMAGVAPIGMTAWHGSPHKFDKFSLDKIGTGEGAQAYGHGLYLAETEDVAKRYRDTLTNFRPDHIESALVASGISPEMANTYAQFAAQKQGGPRAFDDFSKAIIERSPSPYIEQFRDRLRSELPKVQQELNSINGQLYKTDIPDEAVARFLDWDKPLSQQAPEVQKLLANYGDADKRKILDLVRGGEQPDGFGIAKSADGFAPIINGEVVGNGAKDLTFKSMDEVLGYISKQIPSTDPTAASIYRRMVNEHGGSDAISQAQVSGLLQQQGIPGIRYLDGGSRSAGQGSSNFVAFDPEMIRILERNGQATGQQPWKPGEWK